MASIVKANGEIINNVQIPKNDSDSLKFMQETVGGYIEIVPINDPECPFDLIVLNEEGKLKNLPHNDVATTYYNNPYDYIVGDVLLCKDDEVE